MRPLGARCFAAAKVDGGSEKKHPWILRENFGEEHSMMYSKKNRDINLNVVETHEMSMIALDLFMVILL